MSAPTLTPTALQEALIQYREIFLTARNLAPRSRREYATDIRDLVAYLQEQCGLTRPDQVDRTHLEGFLVELDRQGLAGSSRRRKVASICSFCAFLEDRGATLRNPALKLVPPAREKPQPRVLTEGEYKRLLEAVR